VSRTTSRRRNLYTHLTAAVVVPGCLVLCWWQVTRALSGNTLSWAYVFEWPIFAGYGVFMWWKLIHEPRPGAETRPGDGRSGAVTSDDEAPNHPDRAGIGSDPGGGDSGGGNGSGADAGGEDEELAPYNRYLEALNASGKRKRW
jgi:hypothetical protein